MKSNSIITEIVQRVRASLYPDRCCFCGKAVSYGVKVCTQCKKTAPVIENPRCFSCGRAKDDCRCKGHANFYSRITAPFRYSGVVRRGIKLWKFRQSEKNAEYFAKTVVTSVKKDFPDISFDYVTFVPQTKDEMQSRGFNQGEILAKEIGKLLGVRTEALLKKTVSTERQHDLPWYRKSGNVFGVFQCCQRDKVKGKTILLTDDIKTSGLTLNECAKMLRLSDASEIFCAVIAVR